ncbi:MAG: hypothetical protein WC358_02540 [Ignavibacteria bacterium]|jgi:hypothetical protein
MNHPKVLFVILVISFAFLSVFYSCSAQQQQKGFSMYPEITNRDKFFVDPLIFYEVDSLKARLDLYIEVPNDNIIFKKDINDEKYKSNISLIINIKNSVNENILTKTYNEYSAYNDKEMIKKSKESRYFFYNYFVEPGNYKIDIIIKDNNSKGEFKKSADLSVKDFNAQEISFSNLMILSKYKINEDGTKEITPLINNNIFGLKEFFVFFEIYNKNNDDITKEYIYKLKDNKDNIVKEDDLTYKLSPNKNQNVENIFLLKELKKYLPEEPDFDFFLYDNDQNIFFKIEIIDKSNNDLVATKKLAFVPKRLISEMHKKPPMR